MSKTTLVAGLRRIKQRILGSRPSVGTSNWPEREKWIEQALQKIPSGKRILDAGAGELRYKPFCDHLTYVSQDFGQYDGSGDGKGSQTGFWDQSRLDIVCDIIDIPEPDASFDAILCIEVLEHLPEPVAALREFSRLLKPDGVLVLTAPFCSMTHLSPYHFHTGFSRYFYEKWLPEMGFKIEEITFNGNFFEYVAQDLQGLPTMVEKYSKGQVRNRLQRLLRERARQVVLGWLQELSAWDRGSSEVLAFGLHIRACKQ